MNTAPLAAAAPKLAAGNGSTQRLKTQKPKTKHVHAKHKQKQKHEHGKLLKGTGSLEVAITGAFGRVGVCYGILCHIASYIRTNNQTTKSNQTSQTATHLF